MAPLAAEEAAVPELTGRRATGAAEEPGGSTGEAKDSAPGRETVPVEIGEASLDAIAGLHRAANAGDAAAEVSQIPNGDDAGEEDLGQRVVRKKNR
jgi:hypothetical protein